MSGPIREGNSGTAADLAKTAPFQLGPLRVEPAARTIASGGHSEVIEPRAMRVLAALGETPGLVLTRDDLIELCWDGQIVSDNAINRVIFLLRRAFEKMSDGSVRLETITKVGFRIVVDGAEQAAEEQSETARADAIDTHAPAPRKWTRRAAIAGAAAGGAALIYAGINWLRDPTRGLGTQELYERGQFLIKSGEMGSVQQARTFFKQAVTIDPNHADAWGALAATYVHDLSTMYSYRVKVAVPDLTRSAARRALSLGPDQADAQLALAIPLPHFRRWFDHEVRLLDIARRHPNYWFGHAQLGILRLNVGRPEEATEHFRRALEIEPMLPSYQAQFALALHFAGREQEADIAFDQALARWPTYMWIQLGRGRALADSNREAELIAFLRDNRNRPEGAPPGGREAGVRQAEAIATGIGLDKQIQFIRRMIAHDTAGPDLTSQAIHLFWFGAVELAFDALEATYFGGVVEGRRIEPPAPTERRSTTALFSATMLKLRDHPRYASILKRVGLEDYWKKSGTQPDFRKV